MTRSAHGGERCPRVFPVRPVPGGSRVAAGPGRPPQAAALLHLSEGRRQRVAKWRPLPAKSYKKVLKAINRECRRRHSGALVEDVEGGDRQMQL